MANGEKDVRAFCSSRSLRRRQRRRRRRFIARVEFRTEVFFFKSLDVTIKDLLYVYTQNSKHPRGVLSLRIILLLILLSRVTRNTFPARTV